MDARVDLPVTEKVKISVRDLNFFYGSFHALKRINLDIPERKVTAFIGPSGCGKSTLLRTFNRMFELYPEQRAEGQILLDGENILEKRHDVSLIRAKIGMVFQEGALFDSLSVYDNVAYRLREQKVPEDDIEAVVLRMLRFVDLEDAIDKMPNQLSGGMRRRVGIARALVGSPKIILYDEPTAGLDPITARTICELALKLRDLEDVSSIFVTHRLQDIEVLSSEYVVRDDFGNLIFEHEGDKLCLVNTKLMMLKDGDVIFSGTDEEMRQSPDPYIQKFLS